MPTSVEAWFTRRTYDGARFADPVALARRERDLGLSVSILLPCLQTPAALGEMVVGIRALDKRAQLIDQIAVVSAGPGGSKTACPGAKVYSGDDLMPGYGPLTGKGDAMWRAVSVARGDLIAFADVESPDFRPRYVYGVLGPVLSVPEVKFSKAAYRNPAPDRSATELSAEEGVSELVVRPLLSLYYPELAGFLRPLSGEFAGPRSLFRSIPFSTGYATEVSVMIDVLKAVGPDAMAQVVLGQRRYRSRYPADPGSASRGLLQAVEHRSGRASLRGGAEYLGAGYCLQPTSPPGKTRYRSAARGVASLGPLGLHEGRPSLRTNPAQPAPVRRGP